MSVIFFHWHNVKFSKFSCLFRKYLKQSKALTQPNLNNSIIGVIAQSLIENTDCLSILAKFRKSICTHIFAIFKIGMTRKETGHLLTCVKLHRKLIDMSET